MNNGHHIVVLGAGYTGMFSAIRLAHRTRRTGVRITLVNPSSRFVERLRMHQIAAGQEFDTHAFTLNSPGTPAGSRHGSTSLRGPVAPPPSAAAA